MLRLNAQCTMYNTPLWEVVMKLNRMLGEGLVRRIPNYGRAGQNTSIRTYMEPTTRINLRTENHLSELLNSESVNMVLDPAFVSAIATQNQRNQEGAPFKLL